MAPIFTLAADSGRSNFQPVAFLWPELRYWAADHRIITSGDGRTGLDAIRREACFQISLITFQPFARTWIDNPSGGYLIRQSIETRRTDVNGGKVARPNLLDEIAAAIRACVLN
jgi:hypothetical protein